MNTFPFVVLPNTACAEVGVDKEGIYVNIPNKGKKRFVSAKALFAWLKSQDVKSFWGGAEYLKSKLKETMQ